MLGSKKQVLAIEGMMCAHCAKHVEDALNALDGVSGTKVDLNEKTATVKVKDEIAFEVYEKAIVDAGYTLKEVR